jgi:xylan 1,4-beta-xylosidase
MCNDWPDGNVSTEVKCMAKGMMQDMMKWPVLLLATFLVIKCSVERPGQDQQEETVEEKQEEKDPGIYFDNSIGLVPDCADPYILFHEDTYYLYGTGGANRGIRVYQSDNLASWSKAVGTADGFALDSSDVWGSNGFWAPEVYYYEGKFLMFYTVESRIAIAESDSPLGPFVQNEKTPLHPDIKEIDPHLFIDADGKKYLYFVRFTGGNVIWAAEMKDDLSGLKEGTLVEILGVTEPWERTSSEPVARVTEGPFVLKHNGLYYLSYSANHFRSPDYAVGYAISESPLGPFTKYEGNPILIGDGKDIFGTGHHSFFEAGSGQMYMVYHSHKSGESVQPRTTCLDRCDFVKTGNNQPDKLVVYGPTTTPQKIE